jgi:protein-disulfide isomerase
MIEPLDEEIDHVRGSPSGHLIVEHGDCECPYARRAYREIQRVGRRLGREVRFAFRHFPMTAIHPHAWAGAVAAEAAASQDRFWEMHELLFHRQNALAARDVTRYALELELDPAPFKSDWLGEPTRQRVARDVESALASGEVRGTPTLFIDGSVYRGAYDAATLIQTLTG